MSKKAGVYCNADLAGTLEKTDAGLYIFVYGEEYFRDPMKSAISLTLPKTSKVYQSKVLFSFFFGLLSEGSNKEVQCKLLRIDERDHFSHLLATAHTDTIGAVTVRELK